VIDGIPSFPPTICLIFVFAYSQNTKAYIANTDITMGKAKQTRKFAVAKKIISPKDTRVKENAEKAKKKEEELKKKEAPRQVEQAVSALFFQYNTQLGPPYHVLIDTNFINFSIRYVKDARCNFLSISNLPCFC
jgi:hypothetical protein